MRATPAGTGRVLDARPKTGLARRPDGLRPRVVRPRWREL